MDIANHMRILDMIERPAFCVRDGIILRANSHAKSCLFEEGSAIGEFLLSDREAYQNFRGGSLYLTLTSAQVTSGASVTRIEDFDLFIVDAEMPQLEAFALAAGQLKMPLCNLVNMVDSMDDQDPQFTAQRSQLWKQIYQLSRVINNMADVNWLRAESGARQEASEFQSVFAEIMEKMDTVVTAAGRKLEFENLARPVTGTADRELLLRAVSNILSNAVKFSPKGSLIRASLARKDKFLYFSVADQGDGQASRCDIFTGFVRHAGIEDARKGLGLGMAIIHSVATEHGGTVLVEHPEAGGTKVTMTIALRKAELNSLRTPVQLPINNYTGGLDVSLVEFSEVLPPEFFDNNI